MTARKTTAKKRPAKKSPVPIAKATSATPAVAESDDPAPVVEAVVDPISEAKRILAARGLYSAVDAVEFLHSYVAEHPDIDHIVDRETERASVSIFHQITSNATAELDVQTLTLAEVERWNVVFYDPDRIYAPGGFMDWSRDFARGRPETPPAQAPGAPGIADSRLVGYAGAFAREKIGGWTP